MKFTEEKIKKVFSEYENGKEFKENIGKNGLYRQNKINERFYRGDQWHGADIGNMPKARLNVIKRIGEYKIANIASNKIAAQYSAEGINSPLDESEIKTDTILPTEEGKSTDEVEINLVMRAISSYFKTTCERIKFDTLKARVAKKAFISGTSILYIFWNSNIRTGIYADELGTSQVLGDIDAEIIDIENFYPSDPNEENINQMDSIIISQRVPAEKLKAEAKRNGIPKSDIENIKGDNTDLSYSAGDRSEDEIESLNKVTVLTKFFKVENEDGTYNIHAVKCTENCLIRDEYDTGLKNYPFAKFSWEDVDNSFYGDSEVTYLVPNQIAINRMISAAIWAAIMTGMPITLINKELITSSITNEPGQIIEVANVNDLRSAMQYVTPPQFYGEFMNLSQNLRENTLSDSGANQAALGDMRPDNMSAIITVREAAQAPLQTIQNKFYQFCEDAARIMAEFWIGYYGTRKIKMQDNSGVWYLPINADRYRDLIISVKIDVGPGSMWSELQTVSTLDNLLEKGIIDVIQYLERLPKGYVPELNKLLEELKAVNNLQNQLPTPAPTEEVPPEELPTETPEEEYLE